MQYAQTLFTSSAPATAAASPELMMLTGGLSAFGTVYASMAKAQGLRTQADFTDLQAQQAQIQGEQQGNVIRQKLLETLAQNRAAAATGGVSGNVGSAANAQIVSQGKAGLDLAINKSDTNINSMSLRLRSKASARSGQGRIARRICRCRWRPADGRLQGPPARYRSLTQDDGGLMPTQIYQQMKPVSSAQIAAPVLPTVQAQTAEQFAVVMSNLDAAINRSLDVQAVDAAERAGVQAGLKPDFKPTDQSTLAGRAYDRMGIQTYMSELEISARKQIDQLYQDNRQNPDGLKKAITGYADGLRSSVGRDIPQAVPQLDQIIERNAQPYLRQAQADQRKLLQQQAAAASMSSLDSILNSAVTQAQDPNFNDGNAADIALDRQKLIDTMAKDGPPGQFSVGDITYPADPTRTGLFSPDDIQKQVMAFDDQMKVERAAGAFNKILTDKGTVAGTVAFQSFMQNKNTGIEPDVKAKMLDRMYSDLSRNHTIEAQIDSATQAEHKIEQDTLAKDGFELAAKGTLNWKWLDHNKDNLSKTDYDLLTKQVGGGFPAQDNIDSVMHLENVMRDGGDAWPQIQQAARAGQLSQSTFNSLRTRNDAMQKTSGPAADYKQVVNYLDDVFGRNLQWSKWDPVVAQGAEARRRYDQWYESATAANNGNSPTYEQQMMQAKLLINQFLDPAKLQILNKAITPEPSAQFRAYVPGSGYELDPAATMSNINQHFGITADTPADKIPEDAANEIRALDEWVTMQQQMKQLENNNAGAK